MKDEGARECFRQREEQGEGSMRKGAVPSSFQGLKEEEGAGKAGEGQVGVSSATSRLGIWHRRRGYRQGDPQQLLPPAQPQTMSPRRVLSCLKCPLSVFHVWLKLHLVLSEVSQAGRKDRQGLSKGIGVVEYATGFPSSWWEGTEGLRIGGVCTCWDGRKGIISRGRV